MPCLLKVHDKPTIDEWESDDGGKDALQNTFTESNLMITVQLFKLAFYFNYSHTSRVLIEINHILDIFSCSLCVYIQINHILDTLSGKVASLRSVPRFSI